MRPGGTHPPGGAPTLQPLSSVLLFHSAVAATATAAGTTAATCGTFARPGAGSSAAAPGAAAAGTAPAASRAPRPTAGTLRTAAAGPSACHKTVFSYRDLDRLDRDGTFAPLRRALLNPIAIACLRFLTGCFPERMWCISVRTSLCALRPYLRPREREREAEPCDFVLRREDLCLVGILSSNIRRKRLFAGWRTAELASGSESTLLAVNLKKAVS